VDRPDEGDIRIFPKYDDPEVLKVGNPALRPQFTQTFELGYKTNWGKGYLYSALYHRRINDMITRIATVTQGSNNIYSIMQNAGDGFNTGSELVLNQEVTSWFTFNINLNAYQNNISAFSVENEYPVIVTYNMTRTQNYSGNTKLNGIFRLPRSLDIQLTGVYLAPDIIPQGKIDSRYSVDLGLKKGIKNNKGELFINASDLFNTLRIKKDILSNGVKLNSTDVYETQVIRAGYNYKF
jgi:outer membrane receptor protein involved in Fe transport